MTVVNLRCRAQGERPPSTGPGAKDAPVCPVLRHPAGESLEVLEPRAHTVAVGQWYGALKVDRTVRHMRSTTCLCGGQQVLSLDELDRAFRNHVGCSRAGCAQRVILSLVWGSLEESLCVQWKLLQACYASLIPSYWGGKLDDLYPTDPDTGVEKAMQEILLPLASETARWITPSDPEKPFVQGNLTLAEVPWKGLTGLNSLSLEIVGQRVAITDLCAQLGVTPVQVVQKVVDNTRDIDLLTLLLAQEGAT